MKTLYFGGAVLPMDRPGKAQALVVEDGKILAVGALEEVEPLAQGARRVDLEGRALLPAFVDGHSHITALAQTLGLCQLSGCGSLEGDRPTDESLAGSGGPSPPGSGSSALGTTQTTCGKAAMPTKRELQRRPLPDCPAMVTHALLGTWGWSIPWGCKGWASPPHPRDPEGVQNRQAGGRLPQRLPGGGRLYHHGLPRSPGTRKRG